MKLNLDEKRDEATVIMAAKVYESTQEKIQILADTNGVSKSVVIRTAINDLLDREGSR